jgi:hypothetical protein
VTDTKTADELTRMVRRAEMVLNDIEDNANDIGDSNADMVSILGYFAGIADKVLELCPDAKTRFLYEAARNVGRFHGIVHKQVSTGPKGGI